MNSRKSTYTHQNSGRISTEDQLRGKIYDPYPDYQSSTYRSTYSGIHVPCFGARGIRLNESSDDMVWAYDGRPTGLSRYHLLILLIVDVQGFLSLHWDHMRR